MKPYIFAVSSSLIMALAWWTPGTPACAVLGWLASGFLVLAISGKEQRYLPLYFAGIIFQPLGFYWLYTTISYFGGFGPIASSLIFLLYIVLSALQYVVFVFLYRQAPHWLDKFYMRTAAAWVLSEFISVRIFPWYFGHTQLAFLQFVQISDIGGALLVSFLMIWISEAAVRFVCYGARDVSLIVPVLSFVLCLGYGQVRIAQYTAESGADIRVTVVQANVSVEEKHNQLMFADNVERYIKLSRSLKDLGHLVIWPESVLLDYLFSGMKSVHEDERIPWLGPGTAMVFGALSFDEGRHLYNSAVSINADGSMAPFYHKQILMPFGEYTPLKGIFPWLDEINPTGEFSSGSDTKVITISVYTEAGQLAAKITPLICYEDVVSRLGREAVSKGAQLLINLTNDGWFGNTAAPHQHHLIASFRALENRRYLVRSTNTGLSAIVDPLGRTTSRLPTYSDGSFTQTVRLISSETIFSKYTGDGLCWILLAFWGVGFVRRNYAGAQNSR